MERLIRQLKSISVVVPTSVVLFLCISIVFARDPWELLHKIIPSNGNTEDSFGYAVATNGNEAIIGVPSFGREFGKVYIFDLITGKQLFELLPFDTPPQHVEFGISIDVSSHLVIIGAPGDHGNDFSSGSAFVFDTTTGEPLFRLLASDGDFADSLGGSVAINGKLALVGADGDDDNGSNSGSAYIFDLTTGQQLRKLLPSDGTAEDIFGRSVAISGHLAVIGAPGVFIGNSSPGSAYVFDVTTGQQLFKISASDGHQRNSFGDSVAISGHLAVIGAPEDDENGPYSGAAYVFDITTGKQLRKILPSDGYDSQAFGSSVSISGNLAVISPRFDNDQGKYAGAAYVFDVTTGQQLVKLFAPDGSAGDGFGSSGVAISGNSIIIGSPFDDTINGFDAGSAYIFLKTTDLLTVTPDPLVAGQDGIFSIFNTLPEEQTLLIYSLDGLGQTFIPQLNVTIDLAHPKIATKPKITNPNGNLQYEIPIPIISNTHNIWFQAVQDGHVTNFVSTRIVP